MQTRIQVTQQILDAFGLAAQRVELLESGHINDTFKITCPEGDFVLQRVNRFVFPSPEHVMENIYSVTTFLQAKLRRIGGDPDRETLTVRPTVAGTNGFVDDQGNYWRCTTFISGASSHEEAQSLDMLREAGSAFGRFQQLLDDYPADTLYKIIQDFHNTPVRFAQLQTAIREDVKGRAKSVAPEIAFAQAREERCGTLMRLLEQGELPLRVTHNDTKMSNILMDDLTGKAVCVIDLDTVMPGLTAFDFGDAIRAGATTAAEDETDLSIVHFDLERFAAFAQGFLSAAGRALTPTELDTLPDGAILMTYEVGIRFLADYLNGDVYFRVAYPQHNLDRARNQFKLVAEMEQNRPQMAQIIARYAGR